MSVTKILTYRNHSHGHTTSICWTFTSFAGSRQHPNPTNANDGVLYSMFALGLQHPGTSPAAPSIVGMMNTAPKTKAVFVISLNNTCHIWCSICRSHHTPALPSSLISGSPLLPNHCWLLIAGEKRSEHMFTSIEGLLDDGDGTSLSTDTTINSRTII